MAAGEAGEIEGGGGGGVRSEVEGVDSVRGGVQAGGQALVVETSSLRRSQVDGARHYAGRSWGDEQQ